MSVVITLNDSLANQLQAQATVERLPVEDFALKLLAEAVDQRGRSATWQVKNRRRVDLIRKSNRGSLSADEEIELQQLQAELDEHLEHWDAQLLSELSRMEQAVEILPDDGT
jgi:hypothetical protein